MKFSLTLLVAMFVSSMAFAADPPSEASVLILQKLETLQKNLDEIKISLEPIDGKFEAIQQEIKALRTRIDALEKPSKPLDTPKLPTAKAADTLKLVTVAERVANPGYGSVIFKSTYSYPANVAINGLNYQIQSGETRRIDYIPIGIFSYQVFGAHAQPQSRTLSLNEAFTVTICDQPQTTQYYTQPTQYYTQPTYYYYSSCR